MNTQQNDEKALTHEELIKLSKEGKEHKQHFGT